MIDFWGQGYASETLVAVTDHLASCGVIKLVAKVTEGHVASSRVLEKAGFVQNRIIPDADTIRGVRCREVEFIRA